MVFGVRFDSSLIHEALTLFGTAKAAQAGLRHLLTFFKFGIKEYYAVRSLFAAEREKFKRSHKQ